MTFHPIDSLRSEAQAFYLPGLLANQREVASHELRSSCAMNKRGRLMKRIALLLFVAAIVSGVVAARAETSPPTSEPPANLIVDSPLPDLLTRGVVGIA